MVCGAIPAQSPGVMHVAARSSLLLAFLAVACTETADVERTQTDYLTDGGADAGPATETEQEEEETDAGAPVKADAGDAGTNQMVDARDGQTYPTITVGGATWLAKNLSYAIAGSSYCYGDDPKNCEKHGRLYRWSVASTACPAGWHLPSDDEWKGLEAALGMSEDDLDREGYEEVRGTDEGTALKKATGFGATMAGYRAGTMYDARGDRTYFWTATTRGGDVWRRRITAADPTVFRFTNPPSTFAISIRCVKG